MNFKFIDVSPNAISKNMISKFKDVIFVSKGLKYITISSTEGIKQVSLTNNETEDLYHSLHYLNVNNIIVDDEVENTVSTLIANSPMLEHLEMANSEWNITNIMKCVRAVKNNYLMHLNFSNGLNFTLTEIFYSLSRCTALRVLDLHNCCTLKTVSVVTESPKFLHLHHLDLSNNYIDDKAVDYLTALIAANVGLEYLNFCNCELSSSGIQNISNALKVTSSLKFLDLSFNNVDDKSLDCDLMVALLATNKDLEHLRFSNLVLDNDNFHQIKFCLSVIEGLEKLVINNCIFTDEDINDCIFTDTSTIISLIANNPTLHELCLLDCEMSVKSKIEFSCIAAALDKQLGTITVTSPINKKNQYLLNTNTSVLYNVSLTDDDVEAVLTVDNNIRELIMFKLILNQNNLKVLSDNNVVVRSLKLLQIQDCTFTDHYAYYVAALIANNLETIQCFSLTVCQISTKQNMIITKALYKLDIALLQHLNIRDIIYNDDVKHETTASLRNYELVDIITAVMTDHINFIISKLVIKQNTLVQFTQKRILKLIKGVIYLTMKHCKFYNDDNSVANFITNNDRIQELILSTCKFPQEYSEAFKSLSFLRSLNLVCFDNILYPKNFEDGVLAIITNNPGLNHFTMSRFDLNKSSFVKIMHSIAECLNNLLHINFSHLNCSYEVVQHITTVITCNANLVHINLCNCQLLTTDVNNIIQAAKSLTTLEYFNLSHNQMTGDLVNDIKTLTANNKNIKVLSFPNYTLVINYNNCIEVFLNTVTELLVNDIATLIANKNVTELNLLNCTLNNEQFKVVINAVKKSSVPCVHLTINAIDDVTITDVKDVIENKSKIKEFKKVFKLLVIQDMMHHSCDLVELREIDHLTIVGCRLDFKEWNILKQLVVHNAMLNTLILSDCQLYNEISEIVSICTHLSYLGLTNIIVSSQIQLSGNKPIAFKPRLNNLKTISINSVNFTKQMTVDVLNILHNSENLDRFAMVKCNMDGCGDSDLWTAFFASKELLHLDLSYSKINGEVVDGILVHSKYLTHVKMISCDFDQKAIFQICDRFREVYNILYLNLNYNKIFCFYATEIADVIRHKKNLMHIEMAACNFDINGIVKICNSLCSCARLQNINLSHNKIAGHAIDAVVSILHEDLKYINLRKCGLTSDSSKSIIMALASKHSLRFVDLSSNEMAENSALYIAAVIVNNRNIEVLCLPDCIHTSANINERNFLSHYMVKCISDPIKHARSLKCVEFGLCQVNNDLASEVAALSAGNSSLVQLRFSELIVSNSYLKQLGNSILIMEGLNNISITSVQFTYDDSCNVASLINNNKSLQSLDISDCVISEKGKNIIFEAMINLTSLKSLNLKNIVISDEVTVEDKFLAMISSNTHLEYLEVTGCDINRAKLSEVISSFNNLKVVSE